MIASDTQIEKLRKGLEAEKVLIVSSGKKDARTQQAREAVDALLDDHSLLVQFADILVKAWGLEMPS